jgi:hypothetical protein
MHLFRTLFCLFVSAGFLGTMLLSVAGPIAPVTMRAGIRARNPIILPATPMSGQPAMSVANTDATCCPKDYTPRG